MQRLFYHHNAQYSVYGLTDEAGQLVEGYQYDSFGVQTVYQPGMAGGAVTFEAGRDRIAVGPPMADGAAGAGSAAMSAVGNPFTYTGQRYDPEGHGQLYYKNRYYQPTRGRFLSRDPLGFGDGPNRYAYVGNNPANFIDPSGLDSDSVDELIEFWKNNPDFFIQRVVVAVGRMSPREEPKGSDGYWKQTSRGLQYFQYPTPPKPKGPLSNIFLPGGAPLMPPNPNPPGPGGPGGGRRFRSTLEEEEWKAKQRYIEWLRQNGYEVPDRLLGGGPSTTGGTGGADFLLNVGGCMGHDTINWQPTNDGDLNRDGLPDIVWRNAVSEKTVDWQMSQDSRLGNPFGGGVNPFGAGAGSSDHSFDPDTWEVMEKVLNGCAMNDRFWLFATGLTNVEFVITVTDTQRGGPKQYFNPLGRAFAPVQDTSAFATCP